MLANLPPDTSPKNCQPPNGRWTAGVNPIAPSLTSPTYTRPETRAGSRSGKATSS